MTDVQGIAGLLNLNIDLRKAKTPKTDPRMRAVNIMWRRYEPAVEAARESGLVGVGVSTYIDFRIARAWRLIKRLVRCPIDGGA